jgi:hypothetical protein
MDEYLRLACRAADEQWRAADAAHPDGDPDAASGRACDAAYAALTAAGMTGAQARAYAERAARQEDDEGEVPPGPPLVPGTPGGLAGTAGQLGRDGRDSRSLLGVRRQHPRGRLPGRAGRY